jgi:hypothetical protein
MEIRAYGDHATFIGGMAKSFEVTVDAGPTIRGNPGRNLPEAGQSTCHRENGQLSVVATLERL